MAERGTFGAGTPAVSATEAGRTGEGAGSRGLNRGCEHVEGGSAPHTMEVLMRQAGFV